MDTKAPYRPQRFDLSGLEGISDRTLEMHFKLYEGYVQQTNVLTERIDAITRLDGARRRARPPVPRSVKIELTARCDFQCFFCASALRLRAKADIDPAFFRSILREMRALGAEGIPAG